MDHSPTDTDVSYEAFKPGMVVDLPVHAIIIMFILASMTLIMMQGHSGSAEEKYALNWLDNLINCYQW